MGAPITWQNVNTPNPAAAAPLLGQAQTSINGAFDSFNKIMAQRDAFNASQAAQGQEATKQSYLDLLASAKTPEAVAELQRSGALDAARANLSAANLAATRGADEARTTAVRSNETAANAFNDQIRNRLDEQKAGPLKAKILAGTATQADIEAAGLHDPTAVQQLFHDTGRSRLGETRADTTYAEGEADRAHMLDMRPLADRAATRADQAGERTATDAVRLYGLKTEVADFSKNHQLSTQDMRESIDSGLTDFKAPVDSLGLPQVIPRHSDGMIAVDQMTPGLKTAVNAHLSAKGLPTLDDAVGNDSRARNNLMGVLRKHGALPEDLVSLTPSINLGVDTSPAVPIGQEAAILNRNQRIQDVTTRANAATFTPMINPGAVEATKDTAKAVVDSIHPVGTYRNQNWSEAIANYKGIEAIDPQTKKPILGADNKTPIRVLPGAAAWKQILRGIDNSFFGFGNNDIKEAIKKWENDPVTQAGAAASVNDSLVNQFRAVDTDKPAGTK